MRMVGADGVAAITIILYGQFLFNALYLGFSMGVAPVISFQYGAKNSEKLSNVYHISNRFVKYPPALWRWHPSFWRSRLHQYLSQKAVIPLQ